MCHKNVKNCLSVHGTARSTVKGLGHAILGNFSIDQVVIELTEITAQNYRGTQAKHRKGTRMDKTG